MPAEENADPFGQPEPSNETSDPFGAAQSENPKGSGTELDAPPLPDEVSTGESEDPFGQPETLGEESDPFGGALPSSPAGGGTDETTEVDVFGEPVTPAKPKSKVGKETGSQQAAQKSETSSKTSKDAAPKGKLATGGKAVEDNAKETQSAAPPESASEKSDENISEPKDSKESEDGESDPFGEDEEDPRFVSIRRMADELDISFHFLTKILQSLTSEGLLISHRGPKGGVRLAGVTVDADDQVFATFTTDALSTLYLSLDGYDVNYANEVEVFLNDVSIGFLDQTAKKDFGASLFEIDASRARDFQQGAPANSGKDQIGERPGNNRPVFNYISTGRNPLSHIAIFYHPAFFCALGHGMQLG